MSVGKYHYTFKHPSDVTASGLVMHDILSRNKHCRFSVCNIGTVDCWDTVFVVITYFKYHPFKFAYK